MQQTTSTPPASRCSRLGASSLALLALLALLSGCVVAPYGEHYRASTTQAGARERLAFCRGQVGPVTGLDMDLGDGLRLQASTGTDLRSGVPLRLQLDVAAGPELRFAGPVRVLAGDREMPVNFATAARRNWPVQVGEEVHVGRLRPGAGSKDPAQPQGELLLHVQSTGAPPPRMSVQGPDVTFAGEVVRVPAAELSRSTRKPYLYVQGGADSTREEAAGTLPALHWKGRWLYRDTHASAELRLWPRDGRPFRIDAATLQWRDAATGATLPVRVTRAELWFDDRFTLADGVAAAAVETRVALDATLPAGLSGFTVQWPEMVRAGRRIAVAPLRFERRMLDGGVQPFNC